MTPELWREVDRVVSGALELPPEAATAFVEQACGNDTQLRREVEALLAVRPAAAEFLERSEPSLVGRRLGAYRMEREIGRGGMGTVYLAERDDAQFAKKVAVKVVSPGMPSREIAQRFRAERQILASLDHPNIARLLDAGTSDEGVPYLVMEYVEGASLFTYASSHGLDTRARLRLFQCICSAVHFAHQRLVVHRDLKPANILVTAEGTPKLLDFGVAKMLAGGPADTAATVAGSQPMTPDYASPEQIAGLPATTATDVYSLGVVLYELLTGEKPLRLTGVPIAEAIRISSTVQPAAPSSVRSGIAPELDAIVAMAMRKEPEARYSSAEELAADVGRHLVGLPVAAYRGAAWYRARKFVARNRAAVAGAALAAVLAGAAGVAIVYEARLAERRYRDVRKLANSVIYELHDAIASVPGSTAARKLLVTRATEYLDTLAGEAGRDRELKAELAGAYIRVGDVQGHPGQPNLGDPAGALASYGKAQKLLEELAGRSDDLTAQARLAHVHMAHARVLSYLRRGGDAQGRAQRALAIWDRLLRERPKNPVVLEGAASAYFLLADSTVEAPASLAHREHSLALFEQLLAAKPDSYDLQRSVALCLKNLATAKADAKKMEEARGQYLRALELDRKRAAARPQDGQAKLDVSFDLGEIGRTYEGAASVEALDYFQQSLALRRELAAADPLDARIKGRVAFAVMRVGGALVNLQRDAEALPYFREAAAISADLVRATPADAVSRGTMVRALAHVGRAEHRLGHAARGCEADRQAVAAFRELQQRAKIQPMEQKAADAALARLARCGG